MPEREDLLLLLAQMGTPDSISCEHTDQQQGVNLIQAVMILLQQDDFQQGAKSYHLNLQKRAPINALERQLKTRNFIDALNMINRFRE